jgi:hypothetical protein
MVEQQERTPVRLSRLTMKSASRGGGEDQIDCESLGRLHSGRTQGSGSRQSLWIWEILGGVVAGIRPSSISLFEHRA